MKTFSFRNQLQGKSRGKVQCFLWKCVFNNCLMFVFIEKLPKKLSASFAFWRPCLLRQGVERLCRLTTQRSSRLSPSVNLLRPQAWSSSFQDQQFVLVSTPRVHGSHKAGYPFISFTECFIKHEMTIY